MKLFFYYTFHTFLNALKKLFKSWMLVFILVCALIGGLIGVGASTLSTMAGEKDEERVEEVEEKPTVEQKLGIEREEAAELAAGLVVLLIFTVQALSADKNGGRIFLPADVPLLFASPLAPQSVLLFRLGTQLGTALFFGLYLLFQVPNMVLNLGMSLGSALSVIAALALTVAVSKLIQVLLYMLCARSKRLQDTLRYWIYGVLILLFALFFLRYRKLGGTPAQAAVALFNGKISRAVPLWGWLKGFAYYGMTAQWRSALLVLLAILAGIAALVYIIYHIKADFYEDAMAKSEESAEARRRAQGEETTVAMGKRKKDRSDKLRRDGLNYGSGANVFLAKTIYNRFRFAQLGFLTKTMEVYLLAAAGVSIFCRRALDTDPFYPVVMALGVIGFYRSLGDSFATDVKMDFFLLIPESTEKKLFYSLLGNAVCCLLDLLPAMLVTLFFGGTPLKLLVWTLLIVSVDFYGSTVSAFLDVSAPKNAGTLVRNIIQVMFVYFGLIPDVLLIALGVVLEQLPFAVCAAVVVNALLGAVFLSLIPRYIDPPMEHSAFAVPVFSADMNEAKKRFSRIGFGVFAFLAVGSGLQLLVLRFIPPELLQNEVVSYLATFAPLYCVAFPAALKIFGKAPEDRLEKKPLGFTGMLTAIILSVTLMYVGNLIGTFFTAFLSNVSGNPTVNPVLELVSGESEALKIIFIVGIAPLIEEYTFRKCIIDRLRCYGQRRAVLVSALLFGLFHGNFSQFFYAFLLGLVFGTVYVKSGRMRYSLILHMLINTMGSILAPAFLAQLDTAALEGLTAENLASRLTTPLLLYFGYVGFLLLTTLLGLLLLILRRKELRFPIEKYEADRNNALRMCWGNPGMIVNALCCLGLMLYIAFVQ